MGSSFAAEREGRRADFQAAQLAAKKQRAAKR